MKSIGVFSLVALACVAQAAQRAWDVATVDELVRAASEANTAAGGLIRIAPGDYRLTEPLEFSGACHVTLAGGGWNTALRTDGFDALRFVNCSFCVVRDLLVAGNADAGDGWGIVVGPGSSSNTIERCRIAGFAAGGVCFTGERARQMSSNTLRDSHLVDNRRHQLYSLYNNDFYIIGNQFGCHLLWSDDYPATPRPWSGALLDHSSAGTYSMNYHWGNRVALRLAGNCHYNRIVNNRLEESVETALEIGAATSDVACYFNLITANTFHTNSHGAPGRHSVVVAHHAHEVTFTNNQVFSWDSASVRHKTALELAPTCSRWLIKDNILRHHTQAAIIAPTNAEHIVKDNLADP